MRISTLVAFSSLLGGFATAYSAEVKIEEQVVGPAWEQGTIYTLSPKGMHLATMSAKGSRFAVTIDGVEGEKFDQILNAATEVELQYYDTGYLMSRGVKWQGPVAFSPDGSRYAYAARTGKDVIVILDGKEIYRGPYSQVVAAAAFLTFTPDNRHLMFYTQTSDTMQSFQLMFDGKPVTPPFNETPYPVFSADGSRWAFSASPPRATDQRFLVIDGKVASYSGERAKFTPDGKHLVCTFGAQGKQSVLVDGHPLVTAALIERYFISPNGDIGTIASGTDGKKQLYLNGKPAPSGADAWTVCFSPDGKHWAATCISNPSTWVVVDGKKQQEYATVREVGFTPDSSKCVYVAETGVKKFVVIDGVEDAGANYIITNPVYGKTGNHVAYAISDSNGTGVRKAVYDGKVLPVSYNVFNVTLSPDSTRLAYFGGVDALGSQLIVDGQSRGNGGGFGGQVLFSPDSQHVAAIVSPPKGYAATYLDGQFLPFAKDFGYPNLLGFTPDSSHLLTKGIEGGLETYYLDDKRVAQFSMRGVNWMNSQKPVSFQDAADGTIAFIGVTPAENNGYGPMKRVTVTAVPGTNLATWAAAAKTAQEKAVADAAAAKAKADENAVAAKAKAKADADAAVAAKAKARADAIAAKAKAKADAAAAKAAAKGQN